MLVNNAGNFPAGFFEELTPEQMEHQIATNLIGPMNVTRAVLPVMRDQRSGKVVSISSTAGIVGQEFCSAYAASKFGLEGWMESLRFEVEPFGITPRSSSPASSAPSCTRRNRPTTPTCRSTTTPSAPRRPGPPGRG